MDRPASDTPAAAPITAEREAFETEMHKQGWNTRRGSDGEYSTTAIRGAWRGWQARAALSAPPQDMNQCDGCKQGAELRNGLHYDRHGKVFMACQRDNYEPPVAAQPITAEREAFEAALDALPPLAQNEKLQQLLATSSPWEKPAAQPAPAAPGDEVMLNGLTRAETDATASVRGLAAPAAPPADSAMEVLRELVELQGSEPAVDDLVDGTWLAWDAKRTAAWERARALTRQGDAA